jgi:predicted oxidoreductase
LESIRLGKSDLLSSRLAYGCMRIAGDGSAHDRNKGKRAVQVAIDEGYTLFDHADIYGAGLSEQVFGDALGAKPSLRDDIVVVGKCGIRLPGQPNEQDPARYDFRAKYIKDCVEGSLRRLRTDRLDLLLLHRPDYLMSTDEVVEAFTELRQAGKVAWFGVSNFSESKLELLQRAIAEPLLVHQLEINLHNIDAIVGGALDQCQRLGLTPQAWCPVAGVAYPAWGNTLTAEDERRLHAELAIQSRKYEVDAVQVALAWLLMHPAGISPLIGSTTPDRIRDAKRALNVQYSREDWYRLLEARLGKPVP